MAVEFEPAELRTDNRHIRATTAVRPRVGVLKRNGKLASGLPFIVCGLDRSGERNDVRREHLDEQAVLAWPCPPLREHAVVEHPEKGLLTARDCVLHLLYKAITTSVAAGALAVLPEPDVGLPGSRYAICARNAHGPRVCRQNVEEEAVLDSKVSANGFRRCTHEIVEELVIDAQRLQTWHGPSVFADRGE